jgi:hypothetical protein
MNNYQITLGQTYYNKGFINLGVAVSQFIGQNGENLILILGNEGEINITINRNANNNASVRLYGGNTLMLFIQNNFIQNDIMQFQVINPNLIQIL